jgi:ribonuclease P/MRP protein subunit POP1
MITTKEIICPNCRLPRYEPPPGSDPVPSNTKKYCSRLVWYTRPNHDIFGNPCYNQANGKRAKKEKEAASSKTANDNVSTPGSFDSANAPSPGGANDTAAEKASTKKDKGPMIKCGSCDRNVAANRFAAHLEKCMGIAGRKSSRAAMAKIVQPSGSGRGTPLNSSRAGTPLPTSSPKRSASQMSAAKDSDDSDFDIEPPPKKQKLKKYDSKPVNPKLDSISKSSKGSSSKGSHSPSSKPLKLKLKPGGLNKKKSSNLSEAVITAEMEDSVMDDSPPSSVR